MASNKQKKDIMDFFGILSDKEGKDMFKDLKKIKEKNIELTTWQNKY